MKSYYDFLKSHNINVKYIEFTDNLTEFYKSKSKTNIYTYDVCDNVLKNKLKIFFEPQMVI